MSPLRRLSVQVLLRPLISRSPTAASASGPLRTPLPPPRCSPLLVAPPQYTLTPIPQSAAIPGVRRFPQPACVALAPRAFRISAASIPHAPNKPAKALAKARSRHHIPPTLKILSPGSSSPPTSFPFPHLPTMSTCSNCQSRNTTCVRESSNHACDFCRKAKRRCSLVQHPSDRSRRRTRANSPDSHGRPRPPKRPRTTTRGNSLDDFVVPDSASVFVASPTPSSHPPSPPPQPPQSSPESPAGSDRMMPRPHESDFSSRHEYRTALRNWASRHQVTQPLYDERLRRPASSPRRGSPLRGSPRHSPLRRSPRRISDSPVPPSAPAADLQVVPPRPTPECAPSPTPVPSPVPANTTIDIEPIVISSGPPSPSSQSPVIRSTPASPMHVNPEPEGLHPTPPPSVGAAPDHTTPNSSPPPLLNVLRTPRPAERGPSEVPEVVRSRAITPCPAANAPPAAPTRANPFPASRYPTDPNDPALRELFPDEADGMFDAIPADAVEAVLVDIQGRFETILSASVLPPSLRRSTYADFLSEIRELRRHRLQVMAVFNPSLAAYPDGHVVPFSLLLRRGCGAAGVGCSKAPSSSSASEPPPDSESAAEASSPSSPAASDSSSEVPFCFGIFTTSSSSSVSAVSSKDVEPLA
ncbi:hypothetical protein PGT21_011489 [Puccinia graminis f. sp. tritici]|uniref:Zn(2)-C6 fungal-type domain-containing protein n=1 Tax=Puccinia graminis f. sp. tritici TaxID=56615 RepID=A0A5B0QW58_PUCGR|nr:hypothetical protein PGT21_011489 [Puccinia graminis f. sp. tritici]